MLRRVEAAASIEGSWYELAIPVLLLVIMICMGMELVLGDFKRVVEMPRATLVGLAGQMIVLPAAGIGFAQWPGFSPEVAIGVVIITACPGGATSNLFSYLARANIALSVVLTSLSSALCFVTIPFWINLGIDLFGSSDTGAGASTLRLPLGSTIAQLFVVTLLPVAIGMAIRARWPAFCDRVRVPLRRSMVILLVISIVAIVGSEWEKVLENFEVSAIAALILVSSMLVIAYAIARSSRLKERDAFTISIEVGLQNGALATMIAVNVLQQPELLIFPGTYAVLSLIPVSAWTLFMRRRIRAHQPDGSVRV
jgi:BASS family bile acid:Na+ symporter